MKEKLKNGEVIKIADYDRVELEHCDSYGNPISAGWDEIEQILDDEGCPLGMPKFPAGRIITAPEVDWQQRRYEIAKEAVRGVALNCDEFTQSEIECTVKNALSIADALIEELKKN